VKLSPSYLDGALLAVNALPDAGAVFDSHRCFMERIWVFDSLNDWSGHVASTGPYARDHRIFAPNWAQARLVTGSEDLLRWYIRLLSRRRPGRPILLLRGTLSVLTATDIEGLAEELARDSGCPLIGVERDIEDEDWIDGWRRVHRAVFGHLDGDRGTRRPHVAGFCLFRREGDETGNVLEVERLWRGAGLPEPAWPFNGRSFSFEKVSREAPLLVFPYADLGVPAGRTGPLIHLELPVGVVNTCAFLRSLGEAFDRRDGVEQLIESECRELKPKLTPFVSNILGGKGVVVVADPWMAAALSSACRELGMGVPLAVILRRANADDFDPRPLEAAGVDEYLLDPEREEVDDRLRELSAQGICDVVAGSALLRDEAERRDLPYVEITAPYRLEHFATPTPYMGFAGMLHLAERISNAIAGRDHSKRAGRRK
jgi:hypothetical protein